MCNELHSSFLQSKLFSQSFGELTRCSQNMSCGQSEVSKCLAYRHILKSSVNRLEITSDSVYSLRVQFQGQFRDFLFPFIMRIRLEADQTGIK